MQNMNGKSALGLDANVAALLCYIPVCFINLIMSILVIVQDKTNKVARFHAFQSIFLMIGSFILGIVMVILYFVGLLVGFMVDAMIGIPIFTIIIWLLMMIIGIVVGIGSLVAIIISAIKAFNNQIYKLPIIGNLADKYSN